jgi:hypothetical protein
MRSLDITNRHAETHLASGMGWKYLGTITFVFGGAAAISCSKDRNASSAGSCIIISAKGKNLMFRKTT